MAELKKTPLNEYYHESGAKLVDFGGWEMPVQFTSIKEEHNAVREDVGIFDVSNMGEIKVSGKEAVQFLNHVLTNDITKLTDVKAHYTFLCSEQGGVIDDLVAYKLGEDEYILVVNAGNTDKDLEWLNSIEGFDAKVENESPKYCQIAVQGSTAIVAYKIDEDEYILVVNAGNTDKDLEWLNSIEGFEAKVENVCPEYGQIAVQGPNARAMVQKHVEEYISDIKMFEFRTDFKVD